MFRPMVTKLRSKDVRQRKACPSIVHYHASMNCCHQDHCSGLEQLFDQRLAQAELKDYQRSGPAKTTRWLLEALRIQMPPAEVDRAGLSLLDIGGGIGAIQHELVKAGVGHVTAVDASTAYLNVAQQEAKRRGYADRAEYRFGDFVALAPDVAPADVVTLERVICCYPDMRALVQRSAGLARRWYGIVYPRDGWWMHIGRDLFNLVMRVQRNPYRFFVHPAAAVEALLNESGFQRRFYRHTFAWQVLVYERVQ